MRYKYQIIKTKLLYKNIFVYMKGFIYKGTSYCQVQNSLNTEQWKKMNGNVFLSKIGRD